MKKGTTTVNEFKRDNHKTNPPSSPQAYPAVLEADADDHVNSAHSAKRNFINHNPHDRRLKTGCNPPFLSEIDTTKK